MAKYHLKNSNNTVNCEILNEHMGDYIVRFNNGVIQNVPKNRVTHLDKIDEALIDDLKSGVKSAAETVSKYGKKFANKAKEVVQKIKDFILGAFVDNGAIYFYDEDKILNANHPANIVAAAENNKSINFYPSKEVIDACDEFGLNSYAVEHFEFSGEGYNGSLHFPNSDTNESVKYYNSFIRTLFEAEKGEKVLGTAEGAYENNEYRVLLRALKTDGKPYLADYSTKLVVQSLIREYNNLGGDTKPTNLLLYGAPGIGKSAIMYSMKDRFDGFNVIAMNGATLGAEDFSFPARVDDDRYSELMSKMTKHADDVTSKAERFLKNRGVKVCDLSKSWLPFYDSTEEDPQVLEYMKRVANGGKITLDKNGDLQVSEGAGGILFIDEYTRVRDEASNALMTLFSDRKISSNVVLGDKWIVMAAANRSADMNEFNREMSTKWESSGASRWKIVNYVPKASEWLEWATSDNGKGRPNVVEEITNFISEEVRNNPNSEEHGCYYNMYAIGSGDFDQGEMVDKENHSYCCPRTWEMLSDEYIKAFRGDPYLKGVQLKDYNREDFLNLAAPIIGKPSALYFYEYLKKTGFTEQTAKDLMKDGINPNNLSKYPCISGTYPNITGGFSNEFNNNILPLIKQVAPTQDSGKQMLNTLMFITYYSTQNGQLSLQNVEDMTGSYQQAYQNLATTLTSGTVKQRAFGANGNITDPELIDAYILNVIYSCINEIFGTNRITLEKFLKAFDKISNSVQDPSDIDDDNIIEFIKRNI